MLCERVIDQNRIGSESFGSQVKTSRFSKNFVAVSEELALVFTPPEIIAKPVTTRFVINNYVLGVIRNQKLEIGVRFVTKGNVVSVLSYEFVGIRGASFKEDVERCALGYSAHRVDIAFIIIGVRISLKDEKVSEAALCAREFCRDEIAPMSWRHVASFRFVRDQYTFRLGVGSDCFRHVQRSVT
ncbi:MAG: hypothetical protein QOH88_3176 [Verrucomicrobiota bacterium]